MKLFVFRPTLLASLLSLLALASLPGQADEDDILEGAQTSLPKLSQGGRAKIITGDGKESSLAETAKAIWANHDRMMGQLRAAPRGVIFGVPKSEEEFFEDADVFVAVRTTKVVVKDARVLTESDPALAGYLGLSTQVKTLTVNELDATSREGFDNFLQTEIPRLPADHPLRLAAADGPDALLEAIARGEGEIEVIDTLAVPRVAGPAILRGLSGLSVNPPPALNIEAAELFLGNQPELPGSQPRAREQGEPEQVPRAPEGEIVFSTDMLAGFTRGNEWRWQRRWNFPSGFFRLSLGGRYAIGLRVPIRIGGKFSFTRRVDAGSRDEGFGARLELAPTTLDAGEGFYRGVGLAGDKVHGGREFVLNAGVLFGYKLNALWTDVAHKRGRWYGFDYDRNFVPPFGGENSVFNVEVPVDVTRTQIGGPGLSGWAQAGFRVATQGQIGLDAQPLMNGSPTGDPVRLSFPGGTKRIVKMRFPAMPAGQTFSTFGFRVNRPTYRLSASITPQIRFGANIGYRSISKSFRSDWIPLNAFTVNMPDVHLGGHAGTQREFVYNGGTRTFIRDGRPAATPEPERSAEPIDVPARGEEVHLISVQNGQVIRAGVGPGSRLAAVSDSVAAWEKFELLQLADGNILLRSLQNGKYVRGKRGGDGLLSASARNPADAEKFLIRPQRDGTIAIYSPERRLYVRAGIGEQTLLGVASSAVGGWEKFRLNKAAKPDPPALRRPIPKKPRVQVPQPTPGPRVTKPTPKPTPPVLRQIPSPKKPRIVTPRPTATPAKKPAPRFKKPTPRPTASPFRQPSSPKKPRAVTPQPSATPGKPLQLPFFPKKQ